MGLTGRDKRDNNEGDIIRALRRMGCTVVQLSQRGVPDLLVGANGRNYLVEVKNPDNDKVARGGGCTGAQLDWREVWRGQVDDVQSVDDAVAMVNRWRR